MFDDVIYITNSEGEEIEFRILFTFKSDAFHKEYVVYFEEDNEEIFVSSYIQNEDGGGELNDIETDEEWDMVEEVVNAFLEDEEHIDA